MGDRDLYCAKCGTQQPNAPPPPQPPPPLPQGNPLGISDRTAGLLCYIPWMGWIGSVIVLATDYYRSRDRVRFHAFQGLYLFAAWLMADWIFSPMLTGFLFPGRLAGGLLKLAVVGAWVFMLLKVAHDDDYHLPVLGDLAERSVNEQRM